MERDVCPAWSARIAVTPAFAKGLVLSVEISCLRRELLYADDDFHLNLGFNSLHRKWFHLKPGFKKMVLVLNLISQKKVL